MRRIRMFIALALLVALAAIPTSANAAVTEGQLQAICQDLYGDVFGAPNSEPFGVCQWDMAIIGAGSGSYANATGEGVSVGVIDSGVDFDSSRHRSRISTSTARVRSSSADTPTAEPQEVGKWRLHQQDGRARTSTGTARTSRRRSPAPDQRNRDRRGRSRRDDRRDQGVYGRGILLRRLGGGRAPLRGRPAPRCRQPQLVRRSVPLLLQERCGATRNPS